MIKFSLLPLFAFGFALQAQVTYSPISKVTVDPAGTCSNAAAFQYNYTNGNFWGCRSGTWTLIQGGGGSGGGGGLQSPGTNNVLVKFVSGYQTTPATATDVLNTITTILDTPGGLVTLDSNSLLKAAEMPAFTGDVDSTAGTTTLTLPALSGLTAGTYPKVTVNVKGQVTGGASLADSDMPSDVILSTGTYNDPSWVTHLASSKLTGSIPGSLIPASSATLFGGIKDYTCPSGHVSSVAAGVIGCTADAGAGSGGGTVNSVGISGPTDIFSYGSAVTNSGNLILTEQTQSANTFWAGPTSGSAASPGFRAIVSGDIPAIDLSLTGNGGVKNQLPASMISGALNTDSVNYTYGSGWATETQTAKLKQVINLLDAGAACDGATDDTTAFNRATALAVAVNLPPGKTCNIHNPTIPSHTYILGAPGAVLKDSGADSAHPTISLAYTTDVKFSNVTIDQNGNTYSGAGGGNGIVYVQQNGGEGPVFDHVTLKNSGATQTGTKGFILYNTSASLLYPSVQNTILGHHVYVETADNIENHVVVDHLHSNGSQGNAVYLYGDSGGECNVEVSNGWIENVTDSNPSDTGGLGNAIDMDHCQGVTIQNTRVYNTRYSCFREYAGERNRMISNYCEGSNESAAYSEFGGKRDQWINNTFKHSLNGLNITNVASESPEDWSVVRGNYFIDIQDTGIHCEECVAEENTFTDVPIGIKSGNGSTTHNSIIKNNTFRNSGQSGHPQSDVGVAADPTVNSGTMIIAGNETTGNALNVAPVMALTGSAEVTGLTLGSTTNVTYTGTVGGPGFSNGAIACFAEFPFESTHQINGQCGVVSNYSSSSFTVAINSTGWSAYVSPGVDEYPYFFVPWTASGVPSYRTTQYMLIKDQIMNAALLSNLAVGSQVVVPDGSCTTGTVGTGGSGTIAFGLNNAVFCMFDAATKYVMSPLGFSSGGSASGAIVLTDSVSGHQVTITPAANATTHTFNP